MQSYADWAVFAVVLMTGIWLVLLQGAFSSVDGYLTQAQMRYRHGIKNGWSFMEHGGMWADVFIVTPIVAWVGSKYKLDFSWGRLVLLGGAMVVVLIGVHYYELGGRVTPEAHTHHGKTTVAGWIHAVFAVAAIWICAMVYLNLTMPPVTKLDVIMISILLTPFFYLGVAKFSSRWVFAPAVKWQVAIEIIGLWLVTGVRLLYVK